MKILHIAPFNTSGVPITFVRAERKLGHTSRLVTLGRDRRNYAEDICLDLPFLDFSGTRLIKKFVSHPSRLTVSNQVVERKSLPLAWQANGPAEHALVRLREWFWGFRILPCLERIEFCEFDVIQLDGGLEFYRDGRIVEKLKSLGKKIICCYTGSDLRTRGVIPAIEALSDLNVTLEYDHLQLHPNIFHVFFPFETEPYQLRPEPISDPIRIGHAPTNRKAKGSDVVIATVESLKSDYPVELVLIENVSHAESLQRKAQCHIFVDQLGDLGYGLNSLESLAMGIPTCSCLARGFEASYSDHPFVLVNESNLEDKLVELIQSPSLRQELGRRGRAWVEKHHNSVEVVTKIHTLAGLGTTTSQHKQGAVSA
ncbi:MAG: glycosyltransferase [bacterium]